MAEAYSTHNWLKKKNDEVSWRGNNNINKKSKFGNKALMVRIFRHQTDSSIIKSHKPLLKPHVTLKHCENPTGSPCQVISNEDISAELHLRSAHNRLLYRSFKGFLKLKPVIILSLAPSPSLPHLSTVKRDS